MAEQPYDDPDVDSGTEEGAEEEERQRRLQAAYGNLPRSLYDKARDNQDQLTHEERQRLLSRGDVLGKALAYPDSLTSDEIHKALRWPPPDVVRASIQRAAGGTLSTPIELYTKGKEALDRNQFNTEISDDEVFLICNNFHARDDPTYSASKSMSAHGIPGFNHALTLLSRRLGLDIVVFKVAGLRQSEMNWREMIAASVADSSPVQFLSWSPSKPGLSVVAAPTAASQGQPEPRQGPHPFVTIASLQEQYRLGTLPEADFNARMDECLAALRASRPPRLIPFRPDPIPSFMRSPNSTRTHLLVGEPPCEPPSRTDNIGTGPWPGFFPVFAPLCLFREETGLIGYDLIPGWAALPEVQKNAYRARSEQRRREAWAAFEKTLAQRARGESEEDPSPLRQLLDAWGVERPSPEFVKKRLELARERFPGSEHLKPVVHLTGFELFRDELAAGAGASAGAGEGGLDFWEVLRRWEALTDEQRMPFDERSSRAGTWKSSVDKMALAREYAAKAAAAQDLNRSASGRMD